MPKSKESNIRAFVKFVNTSERDVDVHWLNFRGEKISYSTLPPGCHCNVSQVNSEMLRGRHQVHRAFVIFSFSLQINTYVTHPWVFSCSQTGEKLKVNNNDVFFPEPWFKYIKNADNGVVSVGRQEVSIHYPLKSLKSICMWDILFLMNTSNEVDDLEIPQSLRSELQLVQDMSTRCSNGSNNDNDEDENSDYQNEEEEDDVDNEFDVENNV